MKGVLYLEIPEFYSSIPQGVRDSTERPKLGVSGVKDTAKSNKEVCHVTYR